MLKRTNYDAVFKAKVALEAVRGDKTHYKYPYGLKNLKVNKSNMAWW